MARDRRRGRGFLLCLCLAFGLEVAYVPSFRRLDLFFFITFGSFLKAQLVNENIGKHVYIYNMYIVWWFQVVSQGR